MLPDDQNYVNFKVCGDVSHLLDPRADGHFSKGILQKKKRAPLRRKDENCPKR